MIYLIIIMTIVFIYTILTRNSFVQLNNTVNEAFATMDVYLKKRWDLIPNIVDVVKGYTEYEKTTLEDLTKLRTLSYSDISVSDKININENLTQNLSKLLMLSENYPDLKANENFLDLSNKLIQVENDIANARKYYNAVIRNYNNKVQMIPNNIIALIFGYKEKKMFEVPSNEKENVNINL